MVGCRAILETSRVQAADDDGHAKENREKLQVPIHALACAFSPRISFFEGSGPFAVVVAKIKGNSQKLRGPRLMGGQFCAVRRAAVLPQQTALNTVPYNTGI
jgi:hypothetical protein